MNRTNAISQRQKKDGTTTTNSTLVHDRAGNLVLDELYHYRYDAWNRLALVTEKGSLSASLNASNGQLLWSGDAGAWIVHYTYDGLGRLIRKQSPWPDLDPWNRPQVRTEHFYYDGVRRIQETVTDPLPTDSYDPIQVKEEMESPPPASTTSLTTREYIHSPGYVDEVVAEVDIAASSTGSDRPAWVIQDANYNLIALIDDSGAMLHQYTWDPYGQPIHIDRYDTGTGGAPAPFENRIGHQGLFFDRFDGGTQNVLLKQLEVDSATGLAYRGLYQNRNRSYSPHLGRFVQRDPNGSGSALIGSPLSHGGVGRLLPGGPQLDVVYGNGANLFALTGGTPTFRVDPMGLEWQWDYEGVMLPLVMNILDGALPISMLSPLDALLEGYRNLRTLKNRVNREIQQRMYDREEEADWAVDWSRPDDEYGPQTTNPVVYNDQESPFGPLAGFPSNPRYPARAVGNGKAAEAAAKGSGKMRIGRKTKEGTLETTNPGPLGGRFHDGVDPGNPNVMIEVKIASQGATTRIIKQMDKDAALIASREKGVKWILFERNGHPANPDLMRELNNRNIPFEVLGLVP